MKDIEDQARPFLRDLIDGNVCVLDANAQEALTRWIGLKTFVGELDDPHSRALSPSDAEAFYETRTLREGWKIWIGHYIGEDWKYRYHHANARLIHRAILDLIGPSATPNTQATTFVPGHLFIHSFSTAHVGFDYSFTGPALYCLRQIYPVLTPRLVWDDLPVITDEGADLIANALTHMGSTY